MPIANAEVYFSQKLLVLDINDLRHKNIRAIRKSRNTNVDDSNRSLETHMCVHREVKLMVLYV